MIRALLCGPPGFEAEVEGTILSRQDVVVQHAVSLEDALATAQTSSIHIVLVDSGLSYAEKIVQTLRREPATRSLSIVGVSRGDFVAQDADVLEAGANAVLRLPVAPDWDLRLTRLVSVPGRRDVRLAVSLKVVGLFGEARVPALALNLSLNGMLAEAQSDLNVGDEIGLSFEIPTSPDPILGTGRVVRKAGSYRVGLEFLELKGSAPQELGAFLASEGGI